MTSFALTTIKEVTTNVTFVASNKTPTSLPSSLLDPLEGLSMLNCEKLDLEGRSQLPALKGVRGAC